MKSYLFLILILIGTISYSKNHFDAQLCFEKGFEYHKLELFNDVVTSINSNGFNFNLYYRRNVITNKLDLSIGIGVRCYDIDAVLVSSSLKGYFIKPQFSIVASYLLSEKSSINLGAQAENTKDINDFENETTDLLSYSALVEYSFKLTNKLSVLANYKQGFYPMIDIYRMENPSSVIGVGVKYSLK